MHKKFLLGVLCLFSCNIFPASGPHTPTTAPLTPTDSCQRQFHDSNEENLPSAPATGPSAPYRSFKIKTYTKKKI